MIKVTTVAEDPALTYKVSCEYSGKEPSPKPGNHLTIVAAENDINRMIDNIPGSATEAFGRTYHIHDSNGVWCKSVDASPINRF
jgi:hypothetical protein